jgi:hypothetical protein
VFGDIFCISFAFPVVVARTTVCSLADVPIVLDALYLNRRDGPLSSMVVAEDRTGLQDLIKQAKLLLDAERGCLAVVCDDDDVAFIKNSVASNMPPILHLHHSSMFAFMESSRDTRFNPYHSVSVTFCWLFNLVFPHKTVFYLHISCSFCILITGQN